MAIGHGKSTGPKSQNRQHDRQKKPNKIFTPAGVTALWADLSSEKLEFSSFSLTKKETIHTMNPATPVSTIT